MILRNTTLNLAGFAIPLAISLLAIPAIVDGYGVESFGVVTILWAVLGYFGIFDLGIGKALTFVVARARESKPEDEIAALAAQASGLLLMIGAAFGLLWFALSPTLGAAVGRSGSDAFQREVVLTFAIASLAIPLVLASAALRGVMEAYQAFRAVMLVRILSGTLLFVAPLICLQIGTGIAAVAVALVLVRVATLFASQLVCRRLLGRMWLMSWPRWGTVKPLLTVGGWMTVSNVLGPIMGFADRFILGLVAGAAATAYYATSNEIATKLWLLTGALTAVLFPEFARLHLISSDRLFELCGKAQKLVFFFVLPAATFIALFSSEILDVWIGAAFSVHAAPLMQILAASMLVGTMAQVPYSLVQASGRADLTAWLSLALVGPYLAALYYAARLYGSVGVAWVWFARVAVEYVATIVLVRFIHRAISISWFSGVYGGLLLAGSVLLGVVGWHGPIVVKATVFLMAMLLMFFLFWRVMLSEGERVTLWGKIKRLR